MQLTLKYSEITNLIQTRTNSIVNILFKGYNQIDIHVELKIKMLLFVKFKKEIDMTIRLMEYTTSYIKLSYQTEQETLLRMGLKMIKKKMPYIIPQDNNQICVNFLEIPQLRAYVQSLHLSSLYLDQQGINILIDPITFR